MTRSIRSAVVVGDGIAGWSTAAALRKRVPGLSVALVPVPGMRPGLVDMFGGAAPSIGDFHRDIGLDERDVVVRTNAAFRLGAMFEGWSGAGSRYGLGYGPAGAAVGGIPLASLWPRDLRATPFHLFSPSAALGEAGKFVPASGDPMLRGYAHGLQLDLPVYRSFIEAYARHLGVAVPAAGLAGPTVHDGRVASLRLADGGDLTADLYVDATNADARLIGTLADEWEDWSHWLPCDTIVRATGPRQEALPSLDRVVALRHGWRIDSALPERTERAMIASQGALGDDAAAVMLPGATDPIRFRTGRRRRAWIGNVVAVGEAHTVLESLEGAPLHILHTQIDRLVASLPDRDFAAIELANYDRETNAEADRFRDVLIAHHAASDPDAHLPPLLAETLALFRERGRLPVRDGESVSRDHWFALLYGQNVIPRRSDPVAAGVDPAQVTLAMTAFRQRLAAAVATALPHRDYLARLKARA